MTIDAAVSSDTARNRIAVAIALATIVFAAAGLAYSLTRSSDDPPEAADPTSPQDANDDGDSGPIATSPNSTTIGQAQEQTEVSQSANSPSVDEGANTVAPFSAAARDLANCPEMTDSIRRVYLVTLAREPSENELTEAINRYRSGQANLEVLVEDLLASPEYDDRVGELDDDAFVVQTHRTARGRSPDQVDRSFWVTNLESGFPRSRLVLTLAESREMVETTGTQTPLSGYLRWYPSGTHWYCGSGIANELPIHSLEAPIYFADQLFINTGRSDDTIAMRTTLNATPHLLLTDGVVPGDFRSYRWNGLFRGDGGYGTHLDIRAGEATRWLVVFYPTSIGNQRLGWQLANTPG